MSPAKIERAGFGRILGAEAVLVAMWVLAWGDVSVANVLSGAVVAAVLLNVFPVGRLPDRRGHTVRPLQLVPLALAFVKDVLVSHVAMARDVVIGQSRITTGIVACPLRVDSDGLATFLVNLLTLTPGIMPIDVTHGPPVIYVHVLRATEKERILATVRHYETLAVRAFGSPEEVRACS